MSGLWVTPTQYLEFGESRLQDLGREIATRASAWDFSGLIGLLPDPDPILTKRGDSAEILEGLTADGHLLSVIQTRKLGTLKREFKWSPGGGKDKPAPGANQLCDQLIEDLQRVSMYDLISSLLDAPLYGMVPAEIIWRPGKGRARIADLRALPYRWFGFDEENRPRFRSRANMFEGEALPWGKFVLARHFPSYDNPYGLRLLSRCLWPVAFKKGGVKFWVTFIEKYGMPFLLGKYRPGATRDEQELMLSSLVRMVQDAVAVVPEGNVVEMLNKAGTAESSGNQFERLVEAMNAEISKVIMGQTLTAEIGDTGSYAASKTHEDVLDDYRQADQSLVKSVMDQVAVIYRDINAPGAPAPVFTWFETEDPQQDFAERDKALTEGGRVRLTKSYYMRRYSFQADDLEIAEFGPPPAAKDEPARELGGTDESKTEFAETTSYTPEQQALEDLADKAMAKVDLQANEARIVAAVQAAETWDQAVENVLALYLDMDMEGLRELTEQAVLAAELHGRMMAGGSDGNP